LISLDPMRGSCAQLGTNPQRIALSLRVPLEVTATL
jgi:hypothetical protein